MEAPQMQDPKRRSVVKRDSREIDQIPAVGEKREKSDYPDYINRCAKPRPRISRLHLSRCVALLEASRQRLKSESAWTKGTLARDIDGKGTRSTSPVAVSFCLEGTLERAGHDLKLSDRYIATCRRLLFRLVRSRKFKSIADFNDAATTTHDDVLSVLTRGVWVLNESVKYLSHVRYIQRGRSTIEKIISHRQQKKESQES